MDESYLGDTRLATTIIDKAIPLFNGEKPIRSVQCIQEHRVLTIGAQWYCLRRRSESELPSARWKIKIISRLTEGKSRGSIPIHCHRATPNIRCGMDKTGKR